MWNQGALILIIVSLAPVFVVFFTRKCCRVHTCVAMFKRFCLGQDEDNSILVQTKLEGLSHRKESLASCPRKEEASYYSPLAPNNTMEFVLATLWTPASWCLEHNHSPGCAQHTIPLAFWQTNLTLHGLWPQSTLLQQESYPQYCSKETFNRSVIYQVVGGAAEMSTLWPDMEYSAQDNPQHNRLWVHEWDKHGTCSNMAQLTYFQSTLSLLRRVGTPSTLTAHRGLTMQRTQLQDAFRSECGIEAVLQCSKQGALQSVLSCWTVAFDSMTWTTQRCEQEVLAEESCTAFDTILIESV